MRDKRIVATSSVPVALFVFVVAIGAHKPASALPAFAQQTDQHCMACHVGGFGPQLTPVGREFKLGGYTLRSKPSVPLAAMAVASYVATKRDQAEAPTPDSKKNNNLAFDEGSIFLAGGIGEHIGGFAQVTYDGADKAWAWDNLDLRAVGTGKIGGKSLTYGMSLNNSPSVQDAWNTLPVWGFPYTESALAPSPATTPLISEGLAQNVIGLTGYVWIDAKFYLEAGGYTTPSKGTLRFLGADPFDPGNIHGIAPYGRVAYQTKLAGGTVEAGAFALKAALFPGRDQSSGFTDHYTDVGLDASWYRELGSDTVTFNGRYTHERQALRATCALGMADGSIGPGPLSDCANNTLNEIRANASYYWHNAIGATIGVFDITGSRNPFTYADNRTSRPNSSGVQLQLDATPWGHSNSPLGPRFNMRVGIQYTAYARFNSARSNYDGTGRDASDNNTLRVFTWVAF